MSVTLALGNKLLTFNVPWVDHSTQTEVFQHHRPHLYHLIVHQLTPVQSCSKAQL